MRALSKICLLIVFAAFSFSARESYSQPRNEKTSTEIQQGTPVIPPGASVVFPPGVSDEEKVAYLKLEFGNKAEHGITNNFIYIYDTTNHYALWTALLCENVNEAFEKFANAVGFKAKPVDEKMIVVIFANKDDFERYASFQIKDFTTLKNKPIGYYNHGFNRMTVFDVTQTERNKIVQEKKRSVSEVSAEILSQKDGYQTLSVIVHEAAHQVSYNRGLFHRNGCDPLWAVEGLAMLFEAPIGTLEEGGWKVEYDFGPNLDRVKEFQHLVAKRSDGAQFLRDIVASEQIKAEIEGDYAASWALFSYLYKKFPKRLAAYLNHIAKTERKRSTPQDYVAEFESFFTNDWDRLFQEICYFVNDIENDPESFTWKPTKAELRKIKATEKKAEREAKKAAAEKKKAEKEDAEKNKQKDARNEVENKNDNNRSVALNK